MVRWSGIGWDGMEYGGRCDGMECTICTSGSLIVHLLTDCYLHFFL